MRADSGHLGGLLMVGVFCGECDERQPFAESKGHPALRIGWWVSTDGDLFTDCRTCGETHIAYAVSRYADGRDVTFANLVGPDGWGED